VSAAAQVEMLTRTYAGRVMARRSQVYADLAWDNLERWLDQVTGGIL
jgi:hypothetical protein